MLVISWLFGMSLVCLISVFVLMLMYRKEFKLAVTQVDFWKNRYEQRWQQITARNHMQDYAVLKLHRVLDYTKKLEAAHIRDKKLHKIKCEEVTQLKEILRLHNHEVFDEWLAKMKLAQSMKSWTFEDIEHG